VSEVNRTVKLGMACLTPMLACSTYYALERLNNPSPLLYWSIVLAFPTALLSGAGVAAALGTGKQDGGVFWFSVLGFTAPTLLLLVTWLQ
jgi:hypothetical protein